jgi:intron-binding protein aquarius
MTVALSRSRLGLYILGRRSIFESCHELRESFELLDRRRPDKLMLVTGELWPSTRILASEEGRDAMDGEVAMEGVEHLGQYVREMTLTKLKELEQRGGVPAQDMAVDPEREEEEEEENREEENEEEAADGNAEDGDDDGGALSVIHEEEKDE